MLRPNLRRRLRRLWLPPPLPMRPYRVWSWCAALCAAARTPGCTAQNPPADPAAWINEVDLKEEHTDYVYVEIVIRQREHVPEVPIGSLHMQFFSAGGSGSRRKLSATSAPLPDVTVRSDRSCSSDAHPAGWCAGTDNDLYTIRRTYVQRQAGQMNTQLPNNAADWGLALCSGDQLLDFVGYTASDFQRPAAATPGASPGATACGVGFHSTMIGSGGTQLTYPATSPTASVGRYGTGNKIIDYQWGAYNTITKDALNGGRCVSVFGTPNPACQQNFGDAQDAPAPPTAPPPPTTSPTPAPTAGACVGHYEDCPENCAEVSYHYDVTAPTAGWSPALSCHDETSGLRVFEGTVKKCRYGDENCRPPDCILQMAPRGARVGSCAGPTPAGSRCSVGCADDYYRLASADEQPLCDCSALEALPTTCNLEWTNTLGTASCPPTDKCMLIWPVGYHGDVMITDTGDGFCVHLSQCHPDTQYIVQEPPRTGDSSSPSSAYTSDRQCADISSCDVYAEYQSAAPSFGTPGVAGVPGVAGWDRQCLPLTVCRPDQYESTPPRRSPTDPTAPNLGDRVCEPITPCRDIGVEFQVAAPLQDPRALNPLTAPYLTNRVCQACAECSLTEYIRSSCSATANTDCAPLTVCTGNTQEAQRPALNPAGTTYITNRACATEVARCADGEYEKQSEIQTGYTDDTTQQWVDARPRICETLNVCAATEYEPTDTQSSRTCASMQLGGCSDDPSSCSLYCADRACIPLTVCPHGQYEIVRPLLCIEGDSRSGYCADRRCEYWSPICGPDNYQAGEPSGTSDRVCLPLTRCGDGQWAPALVTGFGENLGDRQCTDWRQCGAGQYQLSLPTATVDRQCRDWTACEANEYESHAPEPMQPGGWSIQNRVCHPVSSACQPFGDVTGAHFQFAPPNSTSDRICRPAKAKCATGEWQTSPPAWNSDRGCLPLRVCTSDERQSVAPTATSDRQCEKRSGSGSQTGNDGTASGGGGIVGAVVVLLGAGGAAGATFWHKQEKSKREGLLAKKNAPEEIELDDFK